MGGKIQAEGELEDFVQLVDTEAVAGRSFRGRNGSIEDSRWTLEPAADALGDGIGERMSDRCSQQMSQMMERMAARVRQNSAGRAELGVILLEMNFQE